MTNQKQMPVLRTGLRIEAPDKCGMTTSCISCINFTEEAEFCKLYKARPPARVIAFGCSSYFDQEEIPF